MIRLHTVAAALLVLGLLAACGDDSPPRQAGSDLAGSILVSAASSLTAPFTQIGQKFTHDHLGVAVKFNFGASSALADQVIAGNGSDVFASADQANVTKLDDAGLLDGRAAVFARNRLAIVTKAGNPEGIQNLADLPDAGVISLCDPAVPCGKYTAQALGAAKVSVSEARVTRGQNMQATLAAVTDSDAVAAIVYVTDAKAAGARVATVALPDAQNVIAVYPAVTLKASRNARTAKAFVAFLRGAKGQRVLKEFGFLAPA